MLEKALHIIDTTNNWTLRLFGWLVFVVLTVLLIEIISRYVFHAPTIWAHQTAEFFFGGYFILMAGYVFRIRGHVYIDIVYSRFSKRGQAILDLITVIFFLLLTVSLMWWGGVMAAKSWRDHELSSFIWAAPLYPAKTAIPIGAFLLFLQGLAKIIRDIKVVAGRNIENA